MDPGLLEALLSADDATRRAAEAHLTTLRLTVPLYPVHLAATVRGGDPPVSVPVHVRMVATMALKQYVKLHWQEGGDGNDDGDDDDDQDDLQDQQDQHPGQVVVIDPALKPTVRDTLLHVALRDPHERIRALAANTVAKIAFWDWPDEWPALLDTLLLHLSPPASSSPLTASTSPDGALLCLIDLAADIDAQHIHEVVARLLPSLLAIAASSSSSSSSSLSAQTRARSIRVYRELLGVVHVVAHSLVSKDIKDALLLPHWLDCFAAALSSDAPAELAVRIEVVQTLAFLVQHFAKTIKTLFPPLLGPIWRALVTSNQAYVAEVVDASAASSAFNHDGDVVNCESLVYALFTLVLGIVQQKALRQSIAPSLDQLMGLVVSYMQLSDDQVELWSTDVDEFVAHEAEEVSQFSVRLAAEDLVTGVVDTFGNDAIWATVRAVELHSQSGHNSWKVVEALMAVAGLLGEDFVKTVVVAPQQQQKKGKGKGASTSSSTSTTTPFDWQGFLTHIVLPATGATHQPLLAGRALWLASYFAAVVPEQISTELLQRIFASIQPSQPPLLRVSALQSINHICQHMDKKLLQPFLPKLMESMISLLSISSNNVLTLLLETILVLIQADASLCGTYEHMLGPMVLTVWSRAPADPMLNAIVSDFFVLLLKEPSSRPSFQARVLGTLLPAVAANPVDPIIFSTGMELLVHVSKHAQGLPQEQAGAFVHTVLVLLQLLNQGSLEDNKAKQYLVTILTNLLSDQAPLVFSWTDQQGTSALHYLLNFAAVLIGPDQSESAAVRVGDLLSKLIEKAPQDQMLPLIPQLFASLTQRLLTAKLTSLMQSLLSVFARLILQNPVGVVDCLVSIPAPNPYDNGLAAVLTIWTNNSDFFYGRHSIKLLTLALLQLLRLNDPRLNAIMTRGEPVVVASSKASSRGGVTTRSKAKQAANGKPEAYTQVPLPFKIVKIVLNEYDYAISHKEHDDDDDDDDEDDDDEDDEGDEDEDDPTGRSQGKYGDLSDLLYMDGDLDDDEDAHEDASIKSHPLFAVPLEVTLGQFLKAELAPQHGILRALAPHLNPKERKALEAALD